MYIVFQALQSLQTIVPAAIDAIVQSGIDWGAVIPSAMGGGLATAVGFVFKLSKKVDLIDQKLDILNKNFDDHLKNAPTCPHHQELSESVAVLKSQSSRDK